MSGGDPVSRRAKRTGRGKVSLKSDREGGIRGERRPFTGEGGNKGREAGVAPGKGEAQQQLLNFFSRFFFDFKCLDYVVWANIRVKKRFM